MYRQLGRLPAPLPRDVQLVCAEVTEPIGGYGFVFLVMSCGFFSLISVLVFVFRLGATVQVGATDLCRCYGAAHTLPVLAGVNSPSTVKDFLLVLLARVGVRCKCAGVTGPCRC